MRTTIEKVQPLIQFGSYSAYGYKAPDKWAIICHTSSGREEFGRYQTKADAVKDAREFALTLSK